MTYQMMLWEEETPDPLAMDLLALKEAQKNLRKGIFQRHTEMKKEIECLKVELMNLKIGTPTKILEEFPLLKLINQ